MTSEEEYAEIDRARSEENIAFSMGMSLDHASVGQLIAELGRRVTYGTNTTASFGMKRVKEEKP